MVFHIIYFLCTADKHSSNAMCSQKSNLRGGRGTLSTQQYFLFSLCGGRALVE